MSATATNTIHLLRQFDDPLLTTDLWDHLLSAGSTNTVFLTRPWQLAWWQTFGRGQLLLTAAQRAERIVALAPLFSDSGMIFFVGSGGSDYLDFLGDTSDPELLADMLRVAREQVADFVGFRFYHVPDSSQTGHRLRQVAPLLGLECFDEGSLPAPALHMAAHAIVARAAPLKKSLLRHERYFRKSGELVAEHWRDGASIEPSLPVFFQQHIHRWADTASPSIFHEQSQREFYYRMTRTMGEAGWLRFTRVDWNGRPIAFHFGFCYRGTFLWYKPTFDITLAKHSPGEVLLRQLLLSALDEGAHTFDFGLGDEPFKHRFATGVDQVRTWGLYPR